MDNIRTREESTILTMKTQEAVAPRGPPDAYLNASTPRGILFIYNCRNFHELPEKERHGSYADIENIRRVFTQIGYISIIKEDLPKGELISVLRQLVRERIGKEHDSLVAVFMSHGRSDKLRTFDGERISVEEIYSEFSDDNCPNLKGKPKMFLFHFCRINEERQENQHNRLEPTGFKSRKRITDTFLWFAVKEGHKAKRNCSSGSYFIRNLCDVFIHGARNENVGGLYENLNRELLKLSQNVSDLTVIGKKDERKHLYFNP